ncbi:serine/threonine protein kinase [Streptomyces canus]
MNVKGGNPGAAEPTGAAPPDVDAQGAPQRTSRESPTPADLGTRVIRAVRDPRVPEPETAPESDVDDTAVTEPSDAVPDTAPPEGTVSAPGAAVSEERSEVRSETPSGSSVGAALRAGAPTTSTPLASAPTQDSLAAGAPTERFPMPDVPTRETASEASAPTRVGRTPTTHRRPQHPGPDPEPESGGTGTGSDPPLVLGPHPHRVPPDEPPGPAPHRTRRRAALVAAGSVVAASAVVVAIILATSSGSPGDDNAGGSPSESASASVSASEPGASTPGGTPSSTVEGTSRPRSLPPGAHEEAGGFAWATPTGWRRDVKTGAEVHYTSPDGKQELAAKSSLARGDLMETWRTSEQNAHQGQDYRKIRLEETTFREHPAVVWEYTFTLGGVPWHARLLGFNVGDRSYQINTWYQPDIETGALETYERVKDSFTVL